MRRFRADCHGTAGVPTIAGRHVKRNLPITPHFAVEKHKTAKKCGNLLVLVQFVVATDSKKPRSRGLHLPLSHLTVAGSFNPFTRPDPPFAPTMHIPDGPLSPAVCIGTGVIAAVALRTAWRKLESTLATRTVPLTGMVAALIFAGQMVNFPIGLPVSGHLIGATLAASLLGPWGGCLALSLVLVVQMALFADGGKLALGANIFNMALVGTFAGYTLFRAVQSRVAGPKGVLLGSMIGSWASVMAAAFCFCLEFWLSHPDGAYNLSQVWMLMASFHSLIGIGEALITGLIISAVLVQRPDLLNNSTGPQLGGKSGQMVAAGVVLSLIIAAFAAPFASSAPDGLEAVAEQTGFAETAKEPSAWFLSDYSLPIPGTDEGTPLWGKVATATAGLLGTVVVLGLGYLLARRLPGQIAQTEGHNAG